MLQALGKELGTVCTKVVVVKAATTSGIDAFCQLMRHRPLDARCVCVPSVAENGFGFDGAKHFADMLAVNTTLQSVKCAA